MKLVAYSPYRSISSLLDSFSDISLKSPISYNPIYKSVDPKVNIVQDENSLILQFDLPGLKKGDIDIDYNEGLLSVSGKRVYKDQDNQESLHQEISYGEFSRTLDLSDYFLDDKADADYTNGVLQIIFNISSIKNGNSKKIKIK